MEKFASAPPPNTSSTPNILASEPKSKAETFTCGTGINVPMR